MSEARCFDCNETFDPLVAFEPTRDGYQGCPHCDSSLTRLFNQRSGEDEPDPEKADIQYPFNGPGGVES